MKPPTDLDPINYTGCGLPPSCRIPYLTTWGSTLSHPRQPSQPANALNFVYRNILPSIEAMRAMRKRFNCILRSRWIWPLSNSRDGPIVETWLIYLRTDQSLGAAHWVAQWARWKTVLSSQQPIKRRREWQIKGGTYTPQRSPPSHHPQTRRW